MEEKTEEFLCGLVDALVLGIPGPGQKLLWRELEGESIGVKITSMVFLPTYQLGICAPVVYGLYKLGEYLIT